MDQVRATYDRDLDAKYAAARGFVDAVIAPEQTRDTLELALSLSLNYSGATSGPVCFAPDALVRDLAEDART